MERAGSRRISVRMAAGGTSGATVAGLLGYARAAWSNNLDPVAGPGLVFLCSVGAAVGMIAGPFRRTRQRVQ